MCMVSRRVRRRQVLPLATHALSPRDKPRWRSRALTPNRSTRACWLQSALEKLLPNWKGWVFIIASKTRNSWYFLQNYHADAWFWKRLVLAQTAARRSLNNGKGGGEEGQFCRINWWMHPQSFRRMYFHTVQMYSTIEIEVSRLSVKYLIHKIWLVCVYVVWNGMALETCWAALF